MIVNVSINKELILEPYRDIIGSDHDIIFLYGTRDSGKSKGGSQNYVIDLLNTKGAKGVMVRKVKDTIKDSIYEDVKEVLEEWKLIDYFNTTKSPLEMETKGVLDKKKILSRGLDNVAKFKSTKNPTHIIIEEGAELTADDFTTIITTARSNNVKCKVYFMFNPELPKGISKKEDWWLYKDWFSHTTEKSFEHIKRIELGNGKHAEIKYKAIHTTFDGNPFCTPVRKAFYHDLKRTNPSKYLPYCLGEWGATVNETPYFYALNSELNFGSSYEYSTDTYIDLAFDFNHTPSTIMVAQERRDIGKVFVFDLIQADINTFTGKSALESVCTKFKMKYPNVKSYMLRITGDATGKSSTAGRAKNLNYYTDIMNYLGIEKKQIFIRKSNLPYEVSREIINNFIFKLGNKFVICGNTQMLQDTLLAVSYDYGAWKKEAEKNGYGHEVDAFRYYITDLLLKAGKKYKDDIERFLIGYK